MSKSTYTHATQAQRFWSQMKTSTTALAWWRWWRLLWCSLLYSCCCCYGTKNPIHPSQSREKFLTRELNWCSIVFNCAVTIRFDRFQIDIFLLCKKHLKHMNCVRLRVHVGTHSNQLQLHSCAISKIERSLFACLLCLIYRISSPCAALKSMLLFSHC